MGSNISSAFNYMFKQRNVRHRANTKELCKILEDNVRYTVSTGSSVCQIMFYDSSYSQQTIDETAAILKTKGIVVYCDQNYPHKGWAETVIIARISEDYQYSL